MAHGITKTANGRFSRIFKGIAERRLDALAHTIAEELRHEVAMNSTAHTGEALNSIYVSGEGLERFVGSDSKHFYYLDQGFAPVEGKVMSFNPPNAMWRRVTNPKTGKVVITRRKGFKGIHAVEKVANRHR